MIEHEDDDWFLAVGPEWGSVSVVPTQTSALEVSAEGRPGDYAKIDRETAARLHAWLGRWLERTA